MAHSEQTYQKNKDHGALVDVVSVNTSSLSKPASTDHHTEQKKASETFSKMHKKTASPKPSAHELVIQFTSFTSAFS